MLHKCINPISVIIIWNMTVSKCPFCDDFLSVLPLEEVIVLI